MQLHGEADLSAFDKTCKSCGGVNAIGKEAGELPGQFGDIYLETWTNTSCLSGVEGMHLARRSVARAIWRNIFRNLDKYCFKFRDIH